MAKSNSGIKSFFSRKGVSLNPKTYFVDAMGAMAFGLFASLLIGTIFKTIADMSHSSFFVELSTYAIKAAGAAIGIAVARALGATGLVLYCDVAVGMAGYEMGMIIDGKNISGGPVGAYVAVVVATFVGMLISNETRLDIILTPLCTLATGISVAKWICPHLASLMNQIGDLINRATLIHPIFMGIIVSVTMGILLTLPVSSAALCSMIAISGLASGAATAGCCAHMIGFAVISFKDNDLGGSLAQGLGTSMLQMPNIIRNPFIILPVVFTSAITGPIATSVFKLENDSLAAGMGTCGLVGPLGIVTHNPDGGLMMWLGIVFVCFLLPMFLAPAFDALLRKTGLIKEGQMKLEAGRS